MVVKSAETQIVSPGAWSKRPLRDLLDNTATFVTIAELVTSRGLISDPAGSRVLSLARALGAGQSYKNYLGGK